MFNLFAGMRSPDWAGEVASEAFATIEAAEARMRQWAHYGVDAYCNEPDLLWITNAEGEAIRFWDWGAKAPRSPKRDME